MKNIDTGGPAFPRAASQNEHSDYQTAGNYTAEEQEGMTLLDWFAGQALKGQLSCEVNNDVPAAKMATWCYDYAAAMIEARKGESR